MYRIYFFLFFAALCASCAKKYKIEGTSSVSQLDGKMLFIKVPSGNELVKLDSSEVIHGMFSMEGEVDSAVIAALCVDDDCIMPVVLEKGAITINIDNAGMNATGTPLNDCFNDFIIQKNVLDDKAYEVERLESRMIMDGEDPDKIHHEIEKQRAELLSEMNKLTKNFIQSNYDNVLGPGVFIMICNGLPYPILTPLMEEIIDEAPESFKNDPMIEEYVSVARSNMDKIKSAKSAKK